MDKVRRLRPTIDRQPSLGAPEGTRAAWWRENVLKLSRPALADMLDLTSQTIAKFEGQAKVPIMYRLACSAIAGQIEFDWEKATAQVGVSTITFGESGATPGRGLGG